MAVVASTPVLNAEALFDSVGPSYEAAFSTCTEQQTSIDWLLGQLPASASILDIGSGTGRPVCSTLAAAGHSVLGIDVSGAMVAAAKQNVPNAKFEKADIENFTPAEDVIAAGGYNAITAYFSLIASFTQQGIKDCFANIKSWLAPGGIFIFATVPISADSIELGWMGRQTTISSLSQEEVVDELKRLGFEIVKAEQSKFLPKAVEAGICGKDDVWEETHLFVYAKKSS